MMSNYWVLQFLKAGFQGWLAVSFVWWFVWLLFVVLAPLILTVVGWCRYGR